jgi:pyrroline-5-carboxylate reductase
VTTDPRRIGFIGAGNMGEAMIGALIRAGLFPPAAIQASDVNPDRIARLREAYGIRPAENNAALFRACDVVVLAVKPQQMDAVLSEIAGTSGYGVKRPKLVISIAAGIPLRRVEEHLHPPLDADGRKRLAMVRVMPNTPALVGAGVSGMSPNENAGAPEQAAAREILEAMGRVVVLPEAQLDAVTGVSGSGPAYVFYLAEAMAAGGVQAGLDAGDAAELALATIEGAARLMRERGEDPASLRRKVTSPGGTTEAALRVLEDHEVGRRIADAVGAAARRAGELSG